MLDKAGLAVDVRIDDKGVLDDKQVIYIVNTVNTK